MPPLFWDCTLVLAARSAAHHIISPLSSGVLFQLKPYRHLRFLRFLLFKDELQSNPPRPSRMFPFREIRCLPWLKAFIVLHPVSPDSTSSDPYSVCPQW